MVKTQVTRSARGTLELKSIETMQELQCPLLIPRRVLRMPGPKKDAQGLMTGAGDMVDYCDGFPGIYGRQPLYFEDETFVARAAIPRESGAIHFRVCLCRRSKCVMPR